MPAAKPVSGRAPKSGRKAAKAEPPIPAFITLNGSGGGAQKRIKTGFAWDLFLLAPLFGAPLFLRRLPHWGAAILALWVVDLGIGWLAGGGRGAAATQIILFAAFLLVQLWLGFKGNELTAKALLAHGWTVDHPEFVATRRVLERWRLTS